MPDGVLYPALAAAVEYLITKVAFEQTRGLQPAERTTADILTLHLPSVKVKVSMLKLERRRGGKKVIDDRPHDLRDHGDLVAVLGDGDDLGVSELLHLGLGPPLHLDDVELEPRPRPDTAAGVTLVHVLHQDRRAAVVDVQT